MHNGGGEYNDTSIAGRDEQSGVMEIDCTRTRSHRCQFSGDDSSARSYMYQVERSYGIRNIYRRIYERKEQLEID